MAESRRHLAGWLAVAVCAFMLVGPASADLRESNRVNLSTFSSSYGAAAAIDTEGNVYVAASTENVAAGNTFVAKYMPGMTMAYWSNTVDVGGYNQNNVPTAIALKGKTCYVAGYGVQNADDGFIMRYDENGNGSLWYRCFGFTPPGGISDMAIDPVDGTIWALRTSSVWFRLLHLRDNGGSTAEVISDPEYSFKGNSNEVRSIAVTADSVYIGGKTFDGGNWYPWLLRINRVSGATVFSRTLAQWMGSNNFITSLAARDDLLFGVINHGTSEVARFSPANGDIIGWTAIDSDPTSYIFAKVTLHPLQPRLFAVGKSYVRVFGDNLVEVNGAKPSTDCPHLFGVAVSGGLFPEICAVGRDDGGTCATGQGAYAWALEMADGSNTSEKLIVAPNYIDRSKPGSYANIWVKGSGDSQGEVDVFIYDAAGKLVRLLKVEKRSGWGNLEWDGTNADGEQLAPGTYWVTYPGESAKKPVMIVKKRKG